MDLDEPEDYRRLLTILVVSIFVLSLIVVIYLALTPQAATDPYTEFYVLGPEGNASGYPTNLSVGETGSFIIGVVNQEQQPTTYTVRVLLGDETLDERTVALDDAERWEKQISITPQSEGRHRLWIRLYLGQGDGKFDEPYRELWLWIEVSE